MINPTVLSQAHRYRMDFDTATPFRHVVIDYFFEPEPARRLLADFPPFHPDNARNEFGGIGRKAVVQDIARISPFYAEVDRYIRSQPFLNLIAAFTGIPNLIHDEQMFGGGTHENLEGQELDPHVDFNFIEDRKLHRRLNLLLYLNTEWEESWGGCLELHSNPRYPKANQIKVIRPGFNRMVVFETSEHSWHGFEKIQLPVDKKHLSRKLLSIYLYTRDRPASEIVPPHATFYVQRPLPARFAPGHTLQPGDVQQIEELMQRRDHWIAFYQKKELADSGRIQQYIEHIRNAEKRISELEARERQLEDRLQKIHERLRKFRLRRLVLPPAEPEATPRPGPLPASADAAVDAVPPPENVAGWVVPLAGYATEESLPQGFWPDRWTGSPFVYCVKLRQPVHGVEIDGYLPPSHYEMNLQVSANGNTVASAVKPCGFFTQRVNCAAGAGESLEVRISSDRTYSARRAGVSEDSRELMIHLREIRLLHPANLVS